MEPATAEQVVEPGDGEKEAGGKYDEKLHAADTPAGFSPHSSGQVPVFR